MSPKTIAAIAKPLKAKIGAHYRMLQSTVDDDTYWRARADSDLAQQQARYLIQHLADRHAAKTLALAVGLHE